MSESDSDGEAEHSDTTWILCATSPAQEAAWLNSIKNAIEKSQQRMKRSKSLDYRVFKGLEARSSDASSLSEGIHTLFHQCSPKDDTFMHRLLSETDFENEKKRLFILREIVRSVSLFVRCMH